jgi:hypothetical protein
MGIGHETFLWLARPGPAGRLGGGAARQDAPVNLGESKLGFVRRDGQVAGVEGPVAAAETPAVDHGDGRLLKPPQLLPPAVGLPLRLTDASEALGNPTSARAQKHCGVGAPGTIRTCGLYRRRVALYPAELRVPVTRNYSLLISPVNDALTRLKPVRVADHLMAFTCRRLRRSFRRGGCNVVATLPVNVDPKTSLSLTHSIHYQNRPTKRRQASTLSPSEGGALSS